MPPQIDVPDNEQMDSSEDDDAAAAEKLAKISGNTKGKAVNRSENSVLTLLGKHRVVASEDVKIKDLEESFNKMSLLIQKMND